MVILGLSVFLEGLLIWFLITSTTDRGDMRGDDAMRRDARLQSSHLLLLLELGFTFNCLL